MATITRYDAGMQATESEYAAFKQYAGSLPKHAKESENAVSAQKLGWVPIQAIESENAGFPQ